jgi:hypothetical protein
MVSQNDIEGNLPATLEAASKSWVKGRIKSLHDEKDEKDEKVIPEAEIDVTAIDVSVLPVTATALPVEAVAETAPTTPGYDFEDVENSGSLQLPSESTNGNRSIPAVCTICLCPYENGEHVSWSPDRKCQHAFHKDCIIAWLAKKDEPKCPICRQDFCVLTDVPEMVPTPASAAEQQQHHQMMPYNFSQSLSRALALSRLEAAAREQHNNNNIHTTEGSGSGNGNGNGNIMVRFSSTAIRNNEVADEEMGEGSVVIEMSGTTATEVPTVSETATPAAPE